MNSDHRPTQTLRWRPPVALFGLFTLGALATLGLAGAQAQADIVRISSINGVYEAAHADQIDVKPGDVVQLSADVFTEQADGGYSPQSKFAEDFVWTADDATTDACDASQGASCLGATNFEANDYGVSFYVPYDFTGQTLTISVSASDTYGSQDQIVLNNTAFVDNSYTPPTEVVTDPATYETQSLDPEVTLAGQGRWVIIEGVRYFVPYTYREDYTPYQNGYWSWTGDNDNDGDADGWTWISYDPWGWMTDHYGAWRHHQTYGWTWLPFAGSEYRYHRHCVTFFHDGGDNIGWYPYHDGWRDGYRHGRAQGFDDGFWLGYEAGRYYGSAGFYPGFTVLHGHDFGSNNCYDHRVIGGGIIPVWRNGYGNHFYGNYPGYGRIGDVRQSRGWIETGFHVQVPITHLQTRVVGGGQLRYPVGVHPVPAIDARPPFATPGSIHRPYPVGAVFHPGATPVAGGRPVFTAPTSDGRGLAHPPQVFNPGNHSYTPMPPQTSHPVQPNPQNPVYHPGGPTIARPVTAPVYHPGQPVNPGRPVTRPVPVVNPPVVRPTPVTPPVVRPTPVTPPVVRPTPVTPPVVRPTPVTPPVVRPTPVTPPVVRPTPVTPPVVRPTPVTPPVVRPTPVTPPVVRPTPVTPPVVRPTPPVSRPTPVTPPVSRPTPPVSRPTPPVSRPTPPVSRPTPPVSRPTPPVSRPTPPVSRPTPPPSRPTPPVSRPTPPPSRPTPPPVSRPSAPASHPAPAAPHGPHHIES